MKSSFPNFLKHIAMMAGLLLLLLVGLVSLNHLFGKNNTQNKNPQVTETTPVEIADEKTIMGNFIVSYKTTDSNFSKNSYQGRVIISQAEKDSCNDASNIYLFLEENDTRVVSRWISFTEGEQEFLNNQDKEKFDFYVKNLKSLFRVSDGNLLDSSVEAFDVGFINACSVGWFYPVYKETISTDRFDEVAYVEVNNGNGDIAAPPRRYLVIHENNSWLLASGSDGISEWYEKHPEFGQRVWDCIGEREDTRDLELECTSEVWEQYRSEEEIDLWVNDILNNVEYVEQIGL